MNTYITELMGWLFAFGEFPKLQVGETAWTPMVTEAIFWLLVIAAAALLSCRPPKSLQVLAHHFRGFAAHRTRSVMAIGILVLVVRAMLLPYIPVPEPIVHDEFSYILGAETMAAGRLTNPTPALWPHFETLHINMVPSYQSMYPPAQSLFLAIGVKLASMPWLGVCLSVALMCAATCWMLQGWMPPQWALMGGLLCVLRFGTFSYWINGYWGGAVAALGSALVYGAVARFRHRISVGMTVVFALGLLILANSRPYEGFVVACPALAWSIWLAMRQIRSSAEVRRSVAVAFVMLSLGVAAMAYYNWRGTGSATYMPYMANHRQYHITKMFLWQDRLSVPEYRNQFMRTVYVLWEYPWYLKSRYADGLREIFLLKLQAYYVVIIWPLAALLLPSLLGMAHSRRVRLLGCVFLLSFVALMVVSWPPQSQYVGPMVCIALAVLLYGLRRLQTFRPFGRPFGIAMVQVSLMIFCGWMLVRTAQECLDPYHFPDKGRTLFYNIERRRIQTELEGQQGKHLVLVEEDLCRNKDEWVFNGPDLQSAKVIWARSFGPGIDSKLVEYYSDRSIWIVNPRLGYAKAVPYINEDFATTVLEANSARPARYAFARSASSTR